MEALRIKTAEEIIIALGHPKKTLSPYLEQRLPKPAKEILCKLSGVTLSEDVKFVDEDFDISQYCLITSNMWCWNRYTMIAHDGQGNAWLYHCHSKGRKYDSMVFFDHDRLWLPTPTKLSLPNFLVAYDLYTQFFQAKEHCAALEEELKKKLNGIEEGLWERLPYRME